MTSLVDAHLGRILARLDELDVAENTLVVFTSDHGHCLGQHGLVAKGLFHYEDLLPAESSGVLSTIPLRAA